MSDDDARADAETVDALRGARPDGDRARMAEVRSRVQEALFAVREPARLGRFVLLGTLGQGGMGVVHAAYDPELDRKVALKLVRGDDLDGDGARERLIGEARALGRLKHPNVVAVHDVVTIDDRIVVVMEFVDGATLAAWVSARPRSWREVIAVYLQAGRGLAAAHGVGVVHRDFKPANAIVGADGRVRVLDFGLARFAAAPETLRPGAAVTAAPELTMTGALVGTPAYMAPEQLRGEPATAASDQWSFCASLHEALTGVRPFPGDDTTAILARITAGTIERSGRAMPGWLRALIARGLAADPAARFPTMAPLLDALGRERGWRRWRWPAVATLAVGAAAVAVLRPGAGGDAVAPCDGGAAELTAAWSPTIADRVTAHLGGLASPYAVEVTSRVRAGLDRNAASWRAIHRGACEARRRGAITDALYERQLACLRRRLDDVRSAVAVLEQTQPDAVASAADVVARMAPVAWCGELDVVARDQEPPATVEGRAAVAAVRTRLSRAAALDHASRPTEALAEVDAALAEARTTDYPPVVVEAALLKGRIAINLYDVVGATAPLVEAQALALEHGMLAEAVVAGARRIAFDAVEDRDLPGLLRQVELLDPLSRGLRGDRFARPLLLNNIVMLHLARGHLDEARAASTAALASIDPAGPLDLELNAIRVNGAMLVEDPAARAPLFTSAIAVFDDALGPHHPTTLTARSIEAYHTADLAAARAVRAQVCAAVTTFTPTLVAERVRCLRHLAFLDEELGDNAAAQQSYAAIVAQAAAAPASQATVIELARGKLADHAGDRAGALAHYLAALTAARALGTAWWQRAPAAQAGLALAIAQRAAGRHADATATLAGVVDDLGVVTAASRVVEYQRERAQADALLAAWSAHK